MLNLSGEIFAFCVGGAIWFALIAVSHWMKFRLRREGVRD